MNVVPSSPTVEPLPFTRQHPSYGDCLEVKREYYQNSSVLDCVTQCSQSAAHSYMSSSYRSNRLGLSHWDPYAVRRGSCLELCYCNMVEWFWWDSSLISTTNWFSSVLWHCWFGHLACKNRPQNDLLCVEWDVKPYTLTHSPTVVAVYSDQLLTRPASSHVRTTVSAIGALMLRVHACGTIYHHT